MRFKYLLLLLGLLLSHSIAAKPAAWHLWKSELNNQTFCSQTSPGKGWKKIGGPYSDARCEKVEVQLAPQT